ncbi:hypothetical protein [Streptomyces sp. NBC_01565]|uniref:hypothetical protein n=2 Tax=Streptomyces TaxID=1883 RepID=UPI00225B193B|nr:hypothetical protein [Streptomyces sp. NBC_01565]MCX4540762.1 hypothetical protein [Streptomyces sp. NBC_01565]
MDMRRGIVVAAVAGAAGLALGLMPVSGAAAAGLPQTYRCSDEWRGNWSECCDSYRYRNDVPSWCWDQSDASRYRNDPYWNNSWNNDNWNDGRWNNDGWNNRYDNGNWNNDNDNGNWNGNWNNDRGNWNNDGGNWNNGGW